MVDIRKLKKGDVIRHYENGPPWLVDHVNRVTVDVKAPNGSRAKIERCDLDEYVIDTGAFERSEPINVATSFSSTKQIVKPPEYGTW